MMKLISNINSNILNNKSNFITKNNKKNLSLIKILIKLNIIKYIKLFKNKIFINLNNKKIKLIFYKNINIKLKHLKKYKNNILIINTSKGLKLSNWVLNNKIGGLILLKIIL